MAERNNSTQAGPVGLHGRTRARPASGRSSPKTQNGQEAFGFAPAVTLETTGSVLRADGTSSARHTTDIAVPARAIGEVRQSETSGVLDGGPVPRAVFHTDGLGRTTDSRRIAQRVKRVKRVK
jgi:hypothetical protein